MKQRSPCWHPSWLPVPLSCVPAPQCVLCWQCKNISAAISPISHKRAMHEPSNPKHGIYLLWAPAASTSAHPNSLHPPGKRALSHFHYQNSHLCPIAEFPTVQWQFCKMRRHSVVLALLWKKSSACPNVGPKRKNPSPSTTTSYILPTIPPYFPICSLPPHPQQELLVILD